MDYQHPAWAGLYPDGLPDDWHLAYYANVFATHLVSEASWGPYSDAGHWGAETRDGFHWYLECQGLTPTKLEILNRVRAHLPRQRLGLLCHKGTTTSQRSQLAGLGITYLGPMAAGSMKSSAGCWSQSLEDCRASTSCLGLLLSGTDQPPLRQLRSILALLYERATVTQPGLVFLRPGPEAMALLERCQCLLELMGL